MTEWQNKNRWACETKGQWTKKLIPELKLWIERRLGELNFYLTQFLSRHGYFRRYLFDRGKVKTSNCRYCNHNRDDAEHNFFECVGWSELRRQIETITGPITSENVIATMVKTKDNWNAMTFFRGQNSPLQKR